ncbi:MAG: hypothetical protein KJ930_01070 [Gammaproteobacteria bacterium]|nr:hypothetical protein [Gammaproteobacteria bacterium]MBU2224283.1 hypothetical protein [Gammaproteobacteria bacterium]
MNKFISLVPATVESLLRQLQMSAAFAEQMSDMEKPMNQTACIYYRLQIKSKTFRGPTTVKKAAI